MEKIFFGRLYDCIFSFLSFLGIIYWTGAECCLQLLERHRNAPPDNTHLPLLSHSPALCRLCCAAFPSVYLNVGVDGAADGGTTPPLILHPGQRCSHNLLNGSEDTKTGCFQGVRALNGISCSNVLVSFILRSDIQTSSMIIN